MKVLITGGSGFIGSALTRSLLADGHEVWVLSRNPGKHELTGTVHVIGWDGVTSQGWLDVFSKMDAVVNLAGETIGSWPWSKERKERIMSSRLNAGRAVSEAYQKSGVRPPVLIQASGIGYYGALGLEPVSENALPGDVFYAQVAVAWEKSTAQVAEIPGVRRAVIRTSLVLDAHTGILPIMALPVQLFAGGPLGSGQQGVSWIHRDDEVRAIRFLIENPAGQGIFNLSSPQPISNVEFTRKLASVLHRPYWLPAPAFAMKLVLGEMSGLILEGQYVLPTHLLNLGFNFKFDNVEEAFRDLYRAV